MNRSQLIIIAIAAFLVGCANQRGVPNFGHVTRNVWRGGQPDENGWWTLVNVAQGRGGTVIKLNSGRDGIAEEFGFRVVYLPINSYEQTFGKPRRATIDRAVAELERCDRDNEFVFVHCTHGQDRTGLVIGAWEVTRKMHPREKADAYSTMLEFGFHPSLHGLKRYWLEDVTPP